MISGENAGAEEAGRVILNTKDMRYLICIGQEKQITDAARRTGKNPSSLSRCIRRTEDELETAIFRKTPEGLEATMEGKLYLSMAERIVRLEDALKREALW